MFLVAGFFAYAWDRGFEISWVLLVPTVSLLMGLWLVYSSSITRWESIGKARIYGGMIVVELSGYIFCLLPRHQFESDQEFEAFFQKIDDRRAAAAVG